MKYGDEYTAAVFCDEGMGVAELAAKRLDFRAGLAGDEDERDAAALDFREGRFRAGPGISARVEESSVEIGKDKMPGGEHAALYPSRVAHRSPRFPGRKVSLRIGSGNSSNPRHRAADVAY